MFSTRTLFIFALFGWLIVISLGAMHNVPQLLFFFLYFAGYHALHITKWQSLCENHLRNWGSISVDLFLWVKWLHSLWLIIVCWTISRHGILGTWYWCGKRKFKRKLNLIQVNELYNLRIFDIHLDHQTHFKII